MDNIFIFIYARIFIFKYSYTQQGHAHELKRAVTYKLKRTLKNTLKRALCTHSKEPYIHIQNSHIYTFKRDEHTHQKKLP